MTIALDEARRAAFIRAETRLSAPSLVPELRLHLADRALPLWEATESALAARGVPPPYWAFAWPGGQALARFLLDQPNRAKDRSVLDFGAGSGVAAIAAALVGAATVRACEIDAFAATALRLNAEANRIALHVDTRDVLDADPGEEVILIGDMCYERPLAERVTLWARRAANAGRTVLIADPGRAYRPNDGLSELARYAVPTDLDLEDRTIREAVIWRLLPG